ncbi:MAG: sigma-70 family RNA polymerase sigma factor [bacterium]
MEFKQLYDLCFKKLYRFFYYKGVREGEVEDLIQQTFLEIYTKYYKNGSMVNEINIVYGFARNILKRWYESNKNTINLDEDIMESLSVTTFETDEEYDNELNLMSNKVKVAIENLHESTRQVIKLRFLDGLSRKDTAISLGISEDQVHTIQKRGIQYLKEQLITY